MGFIGLSRVSLLFLAAASFDYYVSDKMKRSQTQKPDFFFVDLLYQASGPLVIVIESLNNVNKQPSVCVRYYLSHTRLARLNAVPQAERFVFRQG